MRFLFDTIKTFLFLFIHISTTSASHDGYCNRTFFYHDIYGYGTDITCAKLNKETFSELTNVIVYNEIRLTIKSSTINNIKWHIQRNLPALRQITIINSTLTDSNLFENLKNLRVLSLINSTISEKSYNGINDLVHLETLILNDNSLREIRFNNTVENLERLGLDRNEFQSINDISPCIFPYLVELSLRNNKLLNIKNISCLQNLVRLYLSNNNIDHVDFDLPELIILDLSFNKLRTFKYSLGKMKQLERLNLEGNDLNFIYSDNFKNLISLKYINLKSNKLTTLSDKVFVHNPKLEMINLNDNALSKINLNLSSVTELLVSNNQITSINFMIMLNNLKKLDLSINRIRELPNKWFENFTSLVFLNLSHNKIQNNFFPDSFYGLTNLLQLDLSHNEIKQFKSSKYLCNLKKLNVSNNNLSSFAGFDDLHCLENLNVSYNYLREVNETAIINLNRLRILDLEENRLKHIKYAEILSQLPELRVMNIRNNWLSCEFLDEMIIYFRNNKVNFTVNSKLNYDKENVAGIYCKEREILNSTETFEHDEVKNNKFVIFLSSSGFLAILLIVFFAVRFHLRKKRYIGDTLQLLDRSNKI